MPRLTDRSLEKSFHKTERTYIRLSLGALAALILFVALCWGGHRFYVRWQERKLMHQAHVAFDKNDLRWASLAAQRAYSVDPSSVDACRTLADIAEKQNNGEAIEWRRRVVSIDPGSLGDRLELAETALRFGRPAVAAETLAAVPVSQQNNARYHSAAAHVALTKSDFAGAEKHLTAATRLAPSDPQRQLELAEFQLRSDDRALRDKGRELALRLKNDPKIRLAAIHVLINDALRWHHDSIGVELAKELDALPGAPFADRLLALGILRGLKDPAFTSALTRLESESAHSAGNATKLIGWMNTQGLALLAIDWSKTLAADMLGSIAMRVVLADSYVRLRDWKALQEMLTRGSWDRAEPLRLALQAKAAREVGDDDAFEKNWTAAVGKAAGDPERLNLLQRIAFQWGWPAKATAVLWSLADIREAQREALQGLYRYYAAERDTTGLYRTLARLVVVIPEDPTVKNNFAQVSLLLNADTARARNLAREMHEAHPENGAFASTYAFALFRAGDLPGALKIIRSLTKEQLDDPSIAAYCGVILAAAGQRPAATHYLGASEKAKLLPEEEQLVAEAKASIARQ